MSTARINKRKYKVYLNSPEWGMVRKRKLAQANYRCEDCGKGNIALHVHHLHYRNLFHELDEDLRVLCQPHHSRADRQRRKAEGKALLSPQKRLKAVIMAKLYPLFPSKNKAKREYNRLKKLKKLSKGKVLGH